MKKVITKIDNLNEFIENAQTKWEFLKYEIQTFTIDNSKLWIKKGKKKINWELKLKSLWSNLNSEENGKLYNHCQNNLDNIYD